MQLHFNFIFIKDYYKILRVGRNAESDEIKKSYRYLVHHFHPDKNPDNQFAADYFLELQEAYEVLSSEVARQAYDRERSLLGLNRNKDKNIYKAQDLLHQAQKVAGEVRQMSVYRINANWLKGSLEFLLSKDHLSILMEPGMLPLREAFLNEIFYCVKTMSYPYSEEIVNGINFLAKKDYNFRDEWQEWLTIQHRKKKFRRLVPFAGVLITFLLMYAMYRYGGV